MADVSRQFPIEPETVLTANVRQARIARVYVEALLVVASREGLAEDRRRRTRSVRPRRVAEAPGGCRVLHQPGTHPSGSRADPGGGPGRTTPRRCCGTSSAS